MDIVEIPEGGGFFKPKQHQEAEAILFEVLQFEPQRPDTYKGAVDSVHANVTVFEKDKEPVTYSRQIINHTGLVSRLKRIVGSAAIKRIGTYQTKQGNTGWTLADVDDEARDRVLAYVAELEALEADAPEFDD